MADETPTTEGPAPSTEPSSEPSSEGPSRTRSAASSATSTAKQRVEATSSSRTIFGLMVFAVGFALIGNEVQILSKKTPKAAATTVGAVSQAGSTITSSGRIILGGFFATSILVLLSHAGDPGKQFAVGLAGITALSSVLIKGGAVWGAANSAFGSTPTSPLSTASGGTSPTGATSTTSTTRTTSTTGAT